MSLLLRLEQQQKTFVKIHSNSHISLSFFLISWSEMLNTFENHTRFQTKIRANTVYSFSDQTGAKTLPFGAAHAYMACIREHPQDFNFCFFLRVKVTSIP